MWNVSKYLKGMLPPCLALCASLCGGATVTQNRVEIDVMVVFDKLAVDRAEMSLQETAQRAVNSMNNVLVRSNLNQEIHFNLVGIGALRDYRNHTYINQSELRRKLRRGEINEDQAEDALDKATYDGFEADYEDVVSGRISGLAEARDKAKADIVLMAKCYGEWGLWGVGHGYLMLTEKARAQKGYPADSSRILPERHFFAQFHLKCMDGTIRGMDVFSHETMHVLGCGHSDRQKTGPGPFYYADSIGYHSDDGRYCTLMSYPQAGDRIPHPTVQQVQEDSITILSLSGPYAPKRMGSDANLPGVPQHMGDLMHNNREALRRSAPVVACYRVGGNERVPNASKAAALPMPPLVDTPAFLISSDYEDVPLAELTKVFAAVMPGIATPGALHSTILGTNVAAPRASSALPGGSGKVVWYSLDIPRSGCLRIGVRPYLTTPGLKPVLAVWDAAGNAIPSQKVDDGFLCALDADVRQPGKVYIAVDSGSDRGGQFSILAHFTAKDAPPAPATPQQPAQPAPAPATPQQQPAPATPQQPAQPAAAPDASSGNGMDTLLFLLAFLSGGLAVWLFCGRNTGVQAAPPPLPPQPLGAAPQGSVPTRVVPKDELMRAVRSGGTANLVLDCILSDGSSRRYRVPLAELAAHHNFYVGRKAPCELCIQDPTVSGRHAVFKVRHLPGESQATLLMGDAGSTNGTWVDGTCVQGDDCKKVRQGSEIMLGNVSITVTIE